MTLSSKKWFEDKVQNKKGWSTLPRPLNLLGVVEVDQVLRFNILCYRQILLGLQIQVSHFPSKAQKNMTSC